MLQSTSIPSNTLAYGTITRKGQLTIPKRMREALNLSLPSKLKLEWKADSLTIQKKKSINTYLGRISAPSGKDALKARKALEREYGLSD